MASDTSNGRLSDTETSEKPVREQLKKASIAGLPAETINDATSAMASTDGDDNQRTDTEETEGRRSLHRKRSFEELEGERLEQSARGPSRNHTRKRSRDSTADEDELNNGQRKVSGESARASFDEPRRNGTANVTGTGLDQRATTPDSAPDSEAAEAAIAVASPKTKRSRLHSAGIEEKGAFAGDKPASTTDANDTQSESTSTTKILPTSGFANTTAVSPFGALAGSKSPSTEPAQTSSSAFASSGFSALAKSSSSGFGAIGASSGGFGSGGSFATGSKSPLAPLASGDDEKASEPSGSAFGGALGAKPAFAAACSGTGFGSGSAFGKVGQASALASPLGGSGFASLGGGGLSSFASGKPSAAIGAPTRSSKAFGAPADDDEDDGEGAEKESETHIISQEDEKQDERFYAQDLETGEEDEKTEYSCRAKLYNFSVVADGKKEWRERGLGVLRLNVKQSNDGDNDGKPKARFLMRAEGSHRVVLNTPIKKEIKFGAPNGGPPTGSFIYFMGTIGNSEGLELLQLKMKAQFALELHEKIVELQAEM
ncbi:Hypothetical protein R9X50_00199600 [Acrodontium crateriforme]|uniref:RanBD1 domain-containing protein n=1 Tax=Acrodontium crateriforme TaxID=150365 RepID=A0AAQ3M3E8_9PEZI|nr:Hypothetical protein R9X50_00199600 [Acrodontium crateriforme]